MFHSQYGQDRYLHENLFLGQRGGTFVEIGALDGLMAANGYQRIGRIGPDDLFARSDRG